jgi:ABC-type transport system involved in cytochrome c biogenesis permease component
VFTAILVMILVLLPVLIPALITAFHAVAAIRPRRTNSRAAHTRVGSAVEPIPASA